MDGWAQIPEPASSQPFTPVLAKNNVHLDVTRAVPGQATPHGAPELESWQIYFSAQKTFYKADAIFSPKAAFLIYQGHYSALPRRCLWEFSSCFQGVFNPFPVGGSTVATRLQIVLVIKQEFTVHTYSVRVHVAGIGVVEETVNAYSPVDALRLVERRYAPAKVIAYNIKQIT